MDRILRIQHTWQVTALKKHINLRLLRLENDTTAQLLLLAIITLLAGVLRFYKLGEWNLWIDEAGTINDSQNPLIYRITWPRISFMLIGMALKTLGPSEWNARLVPALIGLLSVPVLYFPISKMFGARVALLAGLLLAVSPWHLYWSQSARFYTSLMLLSALALLFFYFAFEEDRPGYILVSLFLLALAAVERYIALLLVPVMVGYLLLLKIAPFGKPPGFRARNLLLVSLPGIAFGIRELYYLATGGYYFLSEVIDVFFGQPYRQPPILLAAFVSYLGLPLFCLGLFGSVYMLLGKKRAGLLFVLGAWVPLLLLLGLSLYVKANVRYFLIALPCWVVLGAVAAKEVFSQIQKPGRVLALGVLLLLLADPLHRAFLYYTYENGYRPDWRGAFEVVDQRLAEDDLVLTTKPDIGLYYLGYDGVGPTRGVIPNTIESSGHRVWFVIDERNPNATPDLRLWIRQNCDLIDVLPVSMPGKSMNIWIYLYEPALPSSF